MSICLVFQMQSSYYLAESGYLITLFNFRSNAQFTEGFLYLNLFEMAIIH